MRRPATLWAVLIGLTAVGCVPVQAWQRGALADRRMQAAPQPERAGGRQHVLDVREGAQGGGGQAGGGCGCD